MQINTNSAAQSKVTEKQIQEAQKEAEETIKTYGNTVRVLRVIKDMLREEGTKKLTKRFTDKVKAKLPNDYISLVYPYDGQMVIHVGHNAPKVTVTTRTVPQYGINYGQPSKVETMVDELADYINSYEMTVNSAKRNLEALPTFAAEYNAAIGLVMDIMRKVPILDNCNLKYKLPLMYFQGE